MGFLRKFEWDKQDCHSQPIQNYRPKVENDASQEIKVTVIK